MLSLIVIPQEILWFVMWWSLWRIEGCIFSETWVGLFDDGLLVGFVVDEVEGDLEGDIVGLLLGKEDGDFVGSCVELFVTESVGFGDGWLVGVVEGDLEGNIVGLLLGDCVGWAVGLSWFVNISQKFLIYPLI